MIGTVIGGRYRTTRLLGKGGMGKVYEANDAETGQRVAVKVLTGEITDDGVQIGRFQREARAAAALDTPHIVRILDAGRDDELGLPFMVMEVLEGEDVQQLSRRIGPMPHDLALRIAAQACLGMEKAHEQNIVHRDIKPANLFLTKGSGSERIVKLLDFGIAKLRRDPDDKHAETAGLTRTGSLLGSPLYMSPEQARAHKNLDQRADLWSLGVVLYQALSGRTPYQDSDSLGDLIISICTESPDPVQDIAPWVPADVAAVVHRALQIDPAERFQTAREMHTTIVKLLPNGWDIQESMIRSLSSEEGGVVAPRLTETAAAASGRGGVTQAGAPSSRGAVPSSRGAVGAASFVGSKDPAASVSLDPAGSTSLAVMAATGATVPKEAPARPARGALFGVIAAAAILASGVLVWRALTTGAPPAVQGIPATSDPARRPIVRVVILPADAEVQIGGTKVATKDGVLEIEGALGSVHRVRVVAGAADVTTDIVVTENGAIPPKIDAVTSAKSAPSASSGMPAGSAGTPLANSGAPPGSAGAPSGKSGPLPAASDKRAPVVGPRSSASADIFVDR